MTMRDNEAHSRIDQLETRLSKYEDDLKENTDLTRTVANNTTELVELVRGAKGFRKLIIWVTPLVAAYYGIAAWFKGH